MPTGIFYAFGYIHAHQAAILNDKQGLKTLINPLHDPWWAGPLLALISAPVLLFLVRSVPARLERSWEEHVCEMPVVLCGMTKRLDVAFILVWCLICIAAIQFWGMSQQGLASILFCGGLLTLARIDLQTGLLPDMLTLTLMWLGMLFQLYGGWISLSSSVAGAAGGYGLLWLIFTFYKWKTGREGMGYGDFKLAAALGAWLGVQAIPSLLLYASLSGALVGFLAQRYWRLPGSMAIPFGPFLATAGILILFCDYAPKG